MNENNLGNVQNTTKISKKAHEFNFINTKFNKNNQWCREKSENETEEYKNEIKISRQESTGVEPAPQRLTWA